MAVSPGSNDIEAVIRDAGESDDMRTVRIQCNGKKLKITLEPWSEVGKSITLFEGDALLHCGKSVCASSSEQRSSILIVPGDTSPVGIYYSRGCLNVGSLNGGDMYNCENIFDVECCL